MTRPRFTLSSLWLALVVVSAAWIVMLHARRIAQIREVSEQASTLPAEPASATGYQHGTRGLLLPVGGFRGQAWVMDTQDMAARDSWWIRHVHYDNAPEGRPVRGPSPYHWWLRAVAKMDEWYSGLPAGLAVEQAALWADPALHLLLCLGASLLVAWRHGLVAGGLLALGTAVLFGHAQVFAPGRPDDHGLFLAANLGGWLGLLTAWKERGGRAAHCWLGIAGAAHGLALWLDAGSQLVVFAGVLAGGLTAGWLERRGSGEVAPALPWRSWAAGAAAVAVAGWLIEGRTGGASGVDVRTNHPWLAAVYFGVAEILGWWQRREAGESRLRRTVPLLAGGLLLAAPMGWLLYRGGTGDLEYGPGHPALVGRGSLVGWLRADGLSLGLVAALLPLLLVPAALRLMRQQPQQRLACGFALGGLLTVLACGIWRLNWWGLVDVMLLGLLVVVAAATPDRLAGIAWRSALGVLLLPGLIAAWPRPSPEKALAPVEARALVERDLAQWLAARSEPGTIAFAPPALSAALCYYGGLRVIASPYPGNQDGLKLSARIAGTPSTDEAQALIQQRGIRYLALPSWDDTLDRLAKAGSPTPERSLVALLRQWLPPRWLRPVAYQMPVIPGLEQSSLAVFEVVEPQDNGIALSRLAEYFVDTGRLNLAAAVADTLEQSFAADTGAMIARAKVAMARRETRTLARIMPELLPAIADGRDEDLPWERRANLAIVLAQTKHPDLSRAQVEFCLREADLERLASLSPVSLFRLLALARAFHLDFTDKHLHTTALRLLPAEFQAQLER